MSSPRQKSASSDVLKQVKQTAENVADSKPMKVGLIANSVIQAADQVDATTLQAAASKIAPIFIVGALGFIGKNVLSWFQALPHSVKTAGDIFPILKNGLEGLKAFLTAVMLLLPLFTKEKKQPDPSVSEIIIPNRLPQYETNPVVHFFNNIALAACYGLTIAVIVGTLSTGVGSIIGLAVTAIGLTEDITKWWGARKNPNHLDYTAVRNKAAFGTFMFVGLTVFSFGLFGLPALGLIGGCLLLTGATIATAKVVGEELMASVVTEKGTPAVNASTFTDNIDKKPEPTLSNSNIQQQLSSQVVLSENQKPAAKDVKVAHQEMTVEDKKPAAKEAKAAHQKMTVAEKKPAAQDAKTSSVHSASSLLFSSVLKKLPVEPVVNKENKENKVARTNFLSPSVVKESKTMVAEKKPVIQSHHKT